jgi:hypothetical protein
MALSDADKELMELQRSVAVQGHAAGLPAGPAASNPDTITTFEARRAAQREAWGQFVALDTIHIGNAPAFVAGSQVPLEHVIRFGLLDQELVARVATPEQARVGKTFETDEEFNKANPHVKQRATGIPELHPAALDPRGGAAHLDVKGEHGPALKGAAPDAALTDEQRDEKAGEVASGIVAAGAKQSAPKTTKASAGKDGE